MRISDWSSDVCSSDLVVGGMAGCRGQHVVVESVVEPGQPDTVAEIAHQHGKRRQGDCDDQPFKVNAPIEVAPEPGADAAVDAGHVNTRSALSAAPSPTARIAHWN